jgi:hypothetical protein
MNTVERKPDGTIEYTDCLQYDPTEKPGYGDKPVKGADFDIKANYRRKFPADYPLIIYRRKAFNFDGSRPNNTLVEITQGALAERWAGPLVLYCKHGFNHSSRCQDITLRDFRIFLGFFKVHAIDGLGKSLRTNNYNELEMIDPPFFASMLLRHSLGSTFKGVEITCIADEVCLNAKKFISVDVPTHHPIFDDINLPCPPTKVSKMIELPLKIRRILPDPAWRSEKFTQNPYENQDAEFLNLETDVRSPRWGARDAGALGNPKGKMYGRVLVLREDKVDVSLHQVEALTEYFGYVFLKLAMGRHRSLRGLTGVKLREERTKLMAEHVSKAKFEMFFKEFKKQKITGGDASWEDEPSPYDFTATDSDEDERGKAELMKMRVMQVGLDQGLEALGLDSDPDSAE